MTTKPIAIFYEHPSWFTPLFAALERREVAHDKIFVPDHSFDPSQRQVPYSVVVNRMSAQPSDLSHPQIVLYVKQYLAYLERVGTRVINGSRSYEVGTSKALQITLLDELGLPYPRTRVIHHAGQAPDAAERVGYPVLFKPNIGGSGTGIQLFRGRAELESAATQDNLDFGIDHTALIQQYITAQDNAIIRVEIMGGQYLYSIRLPMKTDSFNYCPADGCNIAAFDHCPVGPERSTGLSSDIEAYNPPDDVIEAVTRIIDASAADLGGVEYLVDAASGQIYYYDINPLSNFVANATEVVGFDPVDKFIDFIRASRDSNRK
jgi:biotin carboxylase